MRLPESLRLTVPERVVVVASMVAVLDVLGAVASGLAGEWGAVLAFAAAALVAVAWSFTAAALNRARRDAEALSAGLATQTLELLRTETRAAQEKDRADAAEKREQALRARMTGRIW